MTTSLSNHGPSARPVDSFDESPHEVDNPYEARLRGLSHQQLADRLKWLSWYQPGIFTGDGLHAVQRRPRRRPHQPGPRP
jgi:hypothetical protein